MAKVNAAVAVPDVGVVALEELRVFTKALQGLSARGLEKMARTKGLAFDGTEAKACFVEKLVKHRKSQIEAFHRACRAGKVSDVRKELDRSGLTVDVRDEFDWTGLHHTSSGKVAKLLLSRGASVEARTCRQQTPLLGCGLFGNSPEVAKALVAAGADIQAVDNKGRTALHYAATNDDAETTAALLLRGADVEARDCFGRTPLLHAFFVDMDEDEDKDEDKSANKWEPRQDDLSRSYFYDFMTHKQPLKLEDDEIPTQSEFAEQFFRREEELPVRAVDLLLNAGAKINAQDNDGKTALHLIAAREYGRSCGNFDEIKVPYCASFIKRGADPCIRDNNFLRPVDNFWAEEFDEHDGDDIKARELDVLRPLYENSEVKRARADHKLSTIARSNLALLSDELFCDLVFRCGDGIDVRAHRALVVFRGSEALDRMLLSTRKTKIPMSESWCVCCSSFCTVAAWERRGRLCASLKPCRFSRWPKSSSCRASQTAACSSFSRKSPIHSTRPRGTFTITT